MPEFFIVSDGHAFNLAAISSVEWSGPKVTISLVDKKKVRLNGEAAKEFLRRTKLETRARDFKVYE